MLGIQAICVVNCGPEEAILRRPQVYAAPMVSGDIAVLVVNWRELDYGRFEFDMEQVLGRQLEKTYLYQIRDLWLHQDHGPYDLKTFSLPRIKGHGVYAWRVKVFRRGEPVPNMILY